ncbi:NlpC/P60 family protein [Robertkochia solimangrovi]|nr:NlpC/P60 family protein [Robertkochia solimangrovi]
MAAAFMISCKSSKHAASDSNNPGSVTVKHGNELSTALPPGNLPEVKSPSDQLADKIVRTALGFSGTRYRYGGTTKKGMDCSGLVYVSFGDNEISMERSSSQMATQGDEIPLRKVKKGDLLFFTTGNNKRRINHVGLVVSVDGDDIQFIHSTTSRGVLVSSLSEGYWNYAFNQARRIL